MFGLVFTRVFRRQSEQIVFHMVREREQGGFVREEETSRVMSEGVAATREDASRVTPMLPESLDEQPRAHCQRGYAGCGACQLHASASGGDVAVIWSRC